MTQARKHRDVTMTPKRGGLRLPPAHIRIATKVVVVADTGCWEYRTNRGRAGYARDYGVSRQAIHYILKREGVL